jgi:hypothetical protein
VCSILLGWVLIGSCKELCAPLPCCWGGCWRGLECVLCSTSLLGAGAEGALKELCDLLPCCWGGCCKGLS